MAALMGVGLMGTLLAPRIDEGQARTRVPFVQAIIEPLADLFRRKGMMLIPILALIACYRLPDFVAGIMANPLYIDLGFTKADIANVSKLYGVWIGIIGAFGGGIALTRLGLWWTLLIGASLAAGSNLMFTWLASGNATLMGLTLSISVDNFAQGFAGAALVAYMSGLTSPGFAATQYALLSSLYALPGKLIGGASGAVVDNLGLPAPLHRHRRHRHSAGISVPCGAAGYDAERAGEGTSEQCRRFASGRWVESVVLPVPSRIG
jgi:PAT family beta-lactamase induction signal transducer AmpG